MSADKYPSIFSRQMEAIVYIGISSTIKTHVYSVSFDCFSTLLLTIIEN